MGRTMMGRWRAHAGRRTALAALAVGALFAVPATGAGAAGLDRADAVEVFERDVFVIVGSTLRNPDATTNPAAPLFNLAGVSLDRTWGQWSSASATSTVRVAGGRSPRTDVRLDFAGLVPAGVYSVFWGTLQPDSENPLCPGVERTFALPSVDPGQLPDASSFLAGNDGRGTFRGRLGADLLAASQVFFSIVYHFDGRTYGPLPNAGEHLTQGADCRSSFGEDAMRHLLVLQKW
jgi:hypothetical protein